METVLRRSEPPDVGRDGSVFYPAQFTTEELALMDHWNALWESWHKMDYDVFLPWAEK